MSKIRIKSLKVKNYRSFWEEQTFEFPWFDFPWDDYKKPVAIIGYNNAWKTNLMNSIKFWLYESVREDTFELKDFHNLKWENSPSFELEFKEYVDNIKDVDSEETFWVKKFNSDKVVVYNEKISKINKSQTTWNKWEIKQNYNIFYINFHKIKDEISTKKSSWWTLSSFLAKHIIQLVKDDEVMKDRKEKFKKDVEIATKEVLNWSENNWSKLFSFIENIKTNYHHNLRNIACEIDFWLPDYEDIFLQMMFKIWLNGKSENLVPIDHFWDWYISMFVMAVIQSIAESKKKDKCLFLFEEPESFLHENHQEYFYKMVLCKLAQNHQVIYTTHSDKMIDIFDTKWLIRLEYNEDKQQTEKRYPQEKENLDFIEKIEKENIWLVDEIKDFNNYIKMIEPNLNKILFSKKVILVEWPNDLLVYKYLIEQKAKEFWNDENFSKAYLNFHNIAIIPHHWKATAWFLIELCKHIWLDYFVINDWDFDKDFQDKIELNFEELKEEVWEKIKEQKNNKWEMMQKSTIKWMITTNLKLIKTAWKDKIHFNVKKLEELVWYDSNDKSPKAIWEKITDPTFQIDEKLFPKSFENFLEFEKTKT